MNYNEYVSEYRTIPALLNYPKGEVLMRCLSKKSRLGTVVHIPATRQSLRAYQSEASMGNLVKIKCKF